MPLTNAAVDVLKSIGVQASGKVFFYTNPDSVTKAFSRVRAKHTDIPDFELITPHILRHTVGYKLKKAKVDKGLGKLITGHKTDQMYDHYGKLDADDIAGTIEDF